MPPRSSLPGRRRPGLPTLASVALVGIGAWSTPCAAQKPLFESDALIEVRLEAPFRTMLREREAARHAASARLGDGAPISIELSARGKSRLESGICSFPGLMLHFDSVVVAGTLWAGQSALPLTTHCKDRDAYEQYVVLEYLAYRAYELVSDLSLATRLARIEYVDSDRGELVATRYGFFLEHWDDLAARRGWMRVPAPAVGPWDYDDDSRNRFEIFQYLIGNTDWSYVSAEPGEEYCCHNAVPIGNPAGPVFPVPFDFDQAGLVDAAYARPTSRLPIRTVRDRFYRGMCVDRSVLDGTLAYFRDTERSMRTLVEGVEALTDRSLADALSYLDAFYRTIRDPTAVEQEFISVCRSMPSGAR